MPRARRGHEGASSIARIRVANFLVTRKRVGEGARAGAPVASRCNTVVKTASLCAFRQRAVVSSGYLPTFARLFSLPTSNDTFPPVWHRLPPPLPRISGFGYLSDPIPDAEVGYRLRCRAHVHVSCSARVNSTIYNPMVPIGIFDSTLVPRGRYGMILTPFIAANLYLWIKCSRSCRELS